MEKEYELKWLYWKRDKKGEIDERLEREQHGMVISAFLKHINRSSERLILKGGTSLMCCYGLDRFSEDIDLDSSNTDIKPFVDSFCRDNNFQYRVDKDTDTVKRGFIHYGNEGHQLKIET